MSCFVVPDFHVSALVSWAVAHGVDLDASPDAVAHMLASANRRAFSERYAGRYDSELVPFGGLDRSASGRALPGYDAAAWCLDEPETWAPDPVLAAHRLAATLASMPEHEVNAIRAALAATRCAA